MSTISLDPLALAPDPAGAPASPAAPLLVCATGPGLEQPHVLLADGVYETAAERVFWRGADRADVLRLPLDAEVSIRSTSRLPHQRAVVREGGEHALLQAVHAARTAPHGRGRAARPPLPVAPDTAASHDGRALSQALQTGDIELAYAHAVQLWRRTSLDEVYHQMSRCLAQLASSWASDTGSVLAEHRATRTAVHVTERLTVLSARPAKCGTVVLAVPEGDQHTAVLGMLGHLLREAGRAAQVVDALPHRELMDLAAAPGTSAVLLSVHTVLPAASLRSLLRDLRTAAPEVLLAVGGPALPPAATATSLGADLLTDDVNAFICALDGAASALTDREAQVLSAVSDGLTNNDIAQLLGVAPATVKSHLDNIFSKTRTEHRAAAVARALRRGWIT